MREAARGKSVCLSVCLQRSVGVAPEVNLRITLHAGTSEDSPWFLSPGQTSSIVRNRGISGPATERHLYLMSSKKLFKNNLSVCLSVFQHVRAYSQETKVKKNQRIRDRHQRKFSLSLGVKRPYTTNTNIFFCGHFYIEVQATKPHVIDIAFPFTVDGSLAKGFH